MLDVCGAQSSTPSSSLSRPPDDLAETMQRSDEVLAASHRRRRIMDPSADVKDASRTTRQRPQAGSTGRMSLAISLPKRLLVGRPIRSAKMGDTLPPKRLALPVFCTDPLSSNAYATEGTLLVLSVGGLSLLHLAPWVAGAVILLLTVVVISYRQTRHACTNGGGACAVSRASLGQNAALIAAGALEAGARAPASPDHRNRHGLPLRAVGVAY
jgi:hypothetical protein